MKKSYISALAAALCLATNGFCATSDEKLFLEPHLAPLAGKAYFQAGTGIQVPQKQSFEHALSLNAGMNIASTMHFVTQKECKVTGLAAHLKEMADNLKAGGKGVITAPASYGTLFTCGALSKEEVEQKIGVALEKIGSNNDPVFIAQTLGELKEVARATFALRDGKLQLITDEKTLSLGEKVWRKNPEGCRQEIYHSEEEYLVAIREAGLVCEELKRPCFFGQVKWNAYNKTANEKLGAAYMDHHPFTIYHVVKKAV